MSPAELRCTAGQQLSSVPQSEITLQRCGLPVEHCRKFGEIRDEFVRNLRAPVDSSKLEIETDDTAGLLPLEISDIILIEKFPLLWDEQHLTDLFSSFGYVMCCYIETHPEYGWKHALVQMDNSKSAAQAVMALPTHVAKTCLPIQMHLLSPSLSRHFPAHIEDYLATGSQRSSSLNKAGEIATHHPPLHPPAANAMTNCHDQVYSKTSTFPASKILPIPSEPEARETVEKSDGSSACTRSAFLSTSKSICVANLPREADTLWVYERFAPYGGVLSVKVLNDKGSGGKCRGICYVNYMDPDGAVSAVRSMDGIRLAGRFLQVSLQQPRLH